MQSNKQGKWGELWEKVTGNETFMQRVKAGILWVGAFVLVAGAVIYLPQFITVSNSVNGRELPIYCVETDKKVVGLSFDAAWA